MNDLISLNSIPTGSQRHLAPLSNFEERATDKPTKMFLRDKKIHQMSDFFPIQDGG